MRKLVFLYFNVNVYLKEISCLNEVTLPYLTLPYHEGFVLPARLKLKPVRGKVLLRDCREHRKQSFYMTLATLARSDAFNAVDINKAVEVLEEKILMDE